jgi:uncharacterized protein YcnI
MDGGLRNWIQLAQDGESRRALLNTAMDIRVPEKAGRVLSSWKRLSIQ